MNPIPDHTAVIARVSRQLQRLTREQRTTRVGSATPTIAEIVQLLTKNGNGSLETALEAPLDSEISYYLGQLIVILDIVIMQDKKPTLIRWFD